MSDRVTPAKAPAKPRMVADEARPPRSFAMGFAALFADRWPKLSALLSRPSRGARSIEALPDRKLMAEVYLPALARRGGRVLMIGCRGYNRADFEPLMAHGAEVWTTDIDPGAARWGVAGRHRTGDAIQIDRVFSDLKFDTVLCNGILGHGVDAVDQQTRCLAAMARIMRTGGVLLLGWNTDRIADPIAAGLVDSLFKPVALGSVASRLDVDGGTHVYDVLERL